MPVALAAFFFVIVHEYIGLAYRFPFLKAFPFALAIIFVLLIYVVNSHGLKEVFSHRQAVFIVCFIFLTVLAMMHGYIRTYATEPVKQEIGFFFLTIAGFYLLDSRDKLNKFAYIFVGIHVYLSLVNFEKFHGPRVGYYTAGVFMGDGNDFAWSLCIAFPLALYLVTIQKSFIPRLMALGAAILILYGITGTQSRGATLALLSSGLFYWFFCSKKKAKSLLVIAIALFALLLVLPQNYFNRMETLENYEQDSSAMYRLKAWGAAIKMAVDHPLLGVGAGSFNSVYGRYYREEGGPVRWISTHSVYFKVLAEYSFLGLFIFISIIYHGLTETWRTRRLILDNPDSVTISSRWTEFLSMSLIAYAVAAVFLSGIDYPHIYVLTALTMATNRVVTLELKNNNTDG